MLNELLNSAKQTIGDLATNVGGGAREHSLRLIEDWLKIFPQLAAYDLADHQFRHVPGP